MCYVGKGILEEEFIFLFILWKVFICSGNIFGYFFLFLINKFVLSNGGI